MQRQWWWHIDWFVYLVRAIAPQLLRDATLTSWYRDPEFNREVGGLPHSLHLIACAADFVAAASDSVSVVALYLPGLLDAVEGETHLHLELGPRFFPSTSRTLN